MVTALARKNLRVPTILDEYGKPIVVPQVRRAVPLNPRGMQTYSAHPEIGLTVESLMGYHRLAENGAPTRQMDMWDGLLERHAEAAGMFSERNEDVSGCDWCITPGRADKPSQIAAEALDECLRYSVTSYVPSPSVSPSTCFRTYLEHQGTHVPFGFACSNLVWDMVDKMVVPIRFEPIAARRFGAPSIERANEIWLIDGNHQSFELLPLDPGLWATTRYQHRNPFAAGLMRSCAWWILFALTGFRDWQIFATMFGLPLTVGYYEEGAGIDSRQALEDAVRGIGQDGYAILSALTEIVIKETARAGDASSVWPMIMKICDKMLTQRITGGTLNTDVSSTGAGSYNAATVHESRLFKMKRRDATRLEDGFTESIGRTFVSWNGYDRAAPPGLKIKIARDELQRAQTVEILGQAMPISKRQMQEEFNLREPDGPSDEVKFMPTAPPDPGHARPEKK